MTNNKRNLDELFDQHETAQREDSEIWNDRDTKNRHRALARKMFWKAHDQASYQCPDCDRRKADLLRPFEIHHKNGDPMDNSETNLVGLCRPCHNLREGKKPSLDEIKNLRDEGGKSDEKNSSPAMGGSSGFLPRPARVYAAGQMDWYKGESYWRTPMEDLDHPTVEVVNPQTYHFEHGGDLVGGVAGEDLELLDSCDGVVAYFDKEEQVGTLIELLHALREQKPALVVLNSDFWWYGDALDKEYEWVTGPVSMRGAAPIYWFLINYLLGDSEGWGSGGDWDGVGGDIEVCVVEDEQALARAYHQWVEVRR